MKKYLLVAINTWSEVFTYRLNFFIWRFRSLVSLLPIYFIWLTIFSTRSSIFGYNESQMLTYVLGTAFINSIVISSRTYLIGDEINTGNLSNYLLKPINYFLYYLSKDLGDKAMNIIFSAIEIGLIIFIFKPPLFFQENPQLLLFAFVSVVVALMIYFFFNILLGLVGFWSPEVWGPRFVFTIVVSFFAGSFFPLDILPKEAFNILSLTPFPYMIYFPVKIYLGTLPVIEIYKGLLVSFSWVILSYLIVKFVWIKGLKAYTAQGR